MASQPSLHNPLPLQHELTRVKRGGQRVVVQGEGTQVTTLLIFFKQICGI
jgi:hypothetical protein